MNVLQSEYEVCRTVAEGIESYDNVWENTNAHPHSCHRFGHHLTQRKKKRFRSGRQNDQNIKKRVI